MMTRSFLPLLRRFRDRDDGSMVVPFALWMPVFILLIVSSIELGTVTIRHTVLERSLDQTIRQIKIGTGASTHDQLKEAICSKASVLPDCLDTLQLEMIVLDLRNWSEPPADADCVDTAQPVTPQRNFQIGVGGQMMFLRACYKYKPVTPIGSFNASLPTDDEGYTGLVSTSAFVHEPS